MSSFVPGRTFVPSMLPETPTPVMFYASWCGYSRSFRQEFDEIPGGIIVDVSDEEDPAWDIWKIRLVPTVILFSEQEPTKRWVGVLGERHAKEIRTAMKQ